MKLFVLLAFIPSLIVADILCPNSKTTCPEGKHCCKVDDDYSCCDPVDEHDVPDIRVKVFPGDELLSPDMFNNSHSLNHTKLSYCDYITCSGTCCADGCCTRYFSATCCGNGKCCPALNDCCSSGCCGAFQKCCGTGCCDAGSACCGTWCCKKGYRCGSGYKTCRSKGVMISSEWIVLTLMAMTAFVSRRL